MSDPGDSGCIVVRNSDTTVTGLNFAGGSVETIANPIFIQEWDFAGSAKIAGGVGELPMFTTRNNIALLPNNLLNSTQERKTTNYDLLPNFTAGKLFLGIAHKVDGRWTQPPPTPIRDHTTRQNFLIAAA